MKIELGNWRIEKAKEIDPTSKTVDVRMIANTLQRDKERQKIVKSAFNKATVANFLKDGYIDYHHISVTGKTKEERAGAIIGRPYDFQWENNLPVVYGRLTKALPVVRDAILPNLEADQAVFAASIGGNVRKAASIEENGKTIPNADILEFTWEHLAIAPSSSVISPGSAVSLIKAHGMSDTILFDCMDSFETDTMNMEGILMKALEVSGQSDRAQLTGIDAIRPANIPVIKYSDLLNEIVDGINNKTIGATEEGILVFLKSKGIDKEIANDFIKKFRDITGMIKAYLQ